MPGAGKTRNPTLICLTGFMGSGKTTVGRMLARQLGWHFVDLDTRIEEASQLKIPAIFERLGEPAFRQMEHEALEASFGEALENGRSTVIALGGGTMAQPQSLALLRSRGCVLVWLECPLEELLARCATMTNRPLFRDEASFRALYEQRRPFYEQADYRVNGAVEPLRVVEQILGQGILERVNA